MPSILVDINGFLHLHHLKLHPLELSQLLLNGHLFDVGLLLLGIDFALGSSAFRADLEEIGAGAAALYSKEKEDVDEER